MSVSVGSEESASLLQSSPALLNRRMTFINDRTVPNSGSTARDHLANERTFLAWLRTALSLSGAGLAFLKFDILSVGDLLFSAGACYALFGSEEVL